MSEKPPLSPLAGILDAAVSLTAPAAPPEMPAQPPGFEASAFDDAEAPPPDDTDWALARACAVHPQNDIGNSRRLRERFGGDMLHVQNIGWHVYDGRRWKEDEDGAGTRPRCHQTVELIALESYVLEPSKHEAELMEAAEGARERGAALELEIRELDDRDITAAQRKKDKADLRQQIDQLRPVIERGEAADKALSARKTQRRRFANTSGNKGKIDGMLAEAVPYLTHALADLDADPLAFNVANGTLRFVQVDVPDPECPDPDAERTVLRWTVQHDPHAREDLIAKLADVVYDPEAKAPLFDAFRERILPDALVADFLQRWFGYNLFALTDEQCFVLLIGEGRNGKSTLVDIIARMMGDYATSIPINTLLASGAERKGSEATPDLNGVPGARMVRAAEPKEGVAFDEALIKQLTAGEPIKVRRLHAEFIEIYPTFKLTISANRKPKINGNDDGIWRRVNVAPFDVQIPKADVDKKLPKKLWDERSGILNWLIAGALDYLERGTLDPPEAVTMATDEYREESDTIAVFLQNGCNITKSSADKVEAGKLYEAFCIWCKRNGTTPLAATTFNRRMPKSGAKLGIEKGKASVSIYTGLSIKPAFEPPPAPAFPR